MRLTSEESYSMHVERQQQIMSEDLIQSEIKFLRDRLKNSEFENEKLKKRIFELEIQNNLEKQAEYKPESAEGGC